MTPSSPPTDNSVIRLALGGLVAMAVAMGLGRFVYTPLLPDLMDGLFLNAYQAGLIASSNYVGYLLGAILASQGWAAGRERSVFAAGLLATTILLFAMSFAHEVWSLSIIRLAAGIASAFVMVFGSTIVFSHLQAAGRDDLQKLHFGGVGVGLVCSALLLLVLTHLDSHWTTGWFAAAGLALLGTIAAVLLVRVDPLPGVHGKRERPLVWDRGLVFITIAYGLFGLGYIVTATFLVAIVREGQGQSPLEGWVWLVTGTAAAVSLVLWAPCRRRFGLFATFVAGCLVEACGVAASVVLPSPVGPFLGGALLGLTFVVVTAYGLQIGRLMAPYAPRKALALMTAAFGTGQIIGPLIAGYLAELSGNYTSGSLVAALALVVAALFAMMANANAKGT